ncbi:N-acetylneuraminate synthase family protein, partial [Campylobacter jejuni]
TNPTTNNFIHRTTEYPAPFDEDNREAMQSLKTDFKLCVGYSDHHRGIHISLAAVALGSCVIEKNFTLDKNISGPDHKASLEPQEQKMLCTQIRQIQKAMGDGIKKARKSEQKNINIVRKSLVAKNDIQKGEIFNEGNITTKRTANGIRAMRYEEYLGKISNKNYKEDELIRE